MTFHQNEDLGDLNDYQAPPEIELDEDEYCLCGRRLPIGPYGVPVGQCDLCEDGEGL